MKKIADCLRAPLDRSDKILVEPGDNMEKARFADTRRTDKRANIALREIEREIIEHGTRGRVCPCGKNLLLNMDAHRHRRHISMRRSSGVKTTTSINRTQATKAAA